MGRRSPESLRNSLERKLIKLLDETGDKVYEDAIDAAEKLYYSSTDDEALAAAEELLDLLRYDDAELRKLALKFAAAVVENL